MASVAHVYHLQSQLQLQPPTPGASLAADITRWVAGSLGLLLTLILMSLYTYMLYRLVHSRILRVLLWSPMALALIFLPQALFPRDTHILGLGAAATVASWWASHKSLSLLNGYGPALTFISPPSARNIPRFIAALCLPAVYEPRAGHSQGFARPFVRAVASLLSLAVVAALALPLLPSASWPVAALAHGLIVYGASAFTADLCAAFAESAGLPTAAAFDAPWKAESLSDFWARRWNRPASAVLRDAVYYPVMDILGGARIAEAADKKAACAAAPRAVRMIAGAATFIVSGVMHEIVLYCLTGKITMEMVAFFSLHGALVAAESALLTRAKECVPRFVRRVLTVAVVLLTGQWLFFPPMLREEVHAKAGSNMCLLFYGVAPKPLARLAQRALSG